MVPTPSAATATAAASQYGRQVASCGTDNPWYGVAHMVPSSDRGSSGLPPAALVRTGSAAVIAFNHAGADHVAPEQLAGGGQEALGAIYGLAYDWRRAKLYASAYYKFAAATGPAGPGAIYELDLQTGAVRPWAWVDAGPDPAQQDFDSRAWDYVGRTGLGDIDIDDEGAALCAVDLYDRLIYCFSVPDGRLIHVYPHGAIGEPWALTARPFGLAIREGLLYHGVVDPAESAPAPARARGSAVIYRSRLDGSEMVEVGRFSLGYRRLPTQWGDWPAPGAGLSSGGVSFGAVLSDIELRAGGDMIIGLRERWCDISVVGGAGDILSAEADNGVYRVRTYPEHYQDFSAAEEVVWGSLAVPAPADIVVAPVVSPWHAGSGGAAWFHNATGRSVFKETLYDIASEPVSFLKSAGLGDVEVLCPAPGSPPSPTAATTPSATATHRATNTATATSTLTRMATATPTPTGSPTASSTPTHAPCPVYLPLALREQCVPSKRRVDVALVIDASTSMLLPGNATNTKLELAVDGARTFLDLLSLDAGDQAAVVTFNDTARLLARLTDDRGTLDAALAAIGTALHTCLPCAVDVASTELASERRDTANTPVLILLTDGKSNPRPASEAVARAAQAKQAGMVIFTIGLDTELDDAALAAIASQPSYYYRAPTADQLADIYRQIAGAIPCPAESFWGRR